MATISGGAPMLGFLGTVTGMVRAFYEMANAGSGNIDITLLSGGIYEAMITTVGGLIVGIIAMFALQLPGDAGRPCSKQNGSSYDGIYGSLERACPKVTLRR